MSTVETNVAGHGNGDAAHAPHDPHLAHHFDTPEQQYASAKLGMWVFLGTEILMFGGLFCAYSVYRHNHPDVFALAHEALNRWLGAANTIVLITSSLTMAWGVRASQLGNNTSLRWLLGVTILGGYFFMGIKAIEYHTKWEHKLMPGSGNTYYGWNGQTPVKGFFNEEAEGEQSAEGAKPGESAKIEGAKSEVAKTESGKATEPNANKAEGPIVTEKTAPQVAAEAPRELPPGAAADGNAGQPDHAVIFPNYATPKGIAAKFGATDEHLTLESLNAGDKQRLYTFFAVYFFMTGLHGVHVLVGMALIYWILLRASGPRRNLWLVPAAPMSVGLFFAYLGVIMGSSRLIAIGVIIAAVSTLWAVMRYSMKSARVATTEGEFGPEYYTPVDLVGLYWHLVDLIWIFLFPLLYLIH